MELTNQPRRPTPKTTRENSNYAYRTNTKSSTLKNNRIQKLEVEFCIFLNGTDIPYRTNSLWYSIKKFIRICYCNTQTQFLSLSEIEITNFPLIKEISNLLLLIRFAWYLLLYIYTSLAIERDLISFYTMHLSIHS